jgi:serine/threonine-protein kinase RsbW
VERVLELQIPASPEFIAVVRLVVSSLVTARRELSDDRVDDLKLAVSEACTNAIEAHDAVSSEAAVTMRLWEDGDRIEVDIADEGPGFDPDTVPAHPPVTDPQRLNFERGLGIRLIRTLVDEVAFESSAHGTTVRMVVYGGPADLGVDILAATEAESSPGGS